MTIKFPNKDLFFARAYYFAFMGGVGFISPFTNLLYVSLGLRGTQIGTIGSLSALVALVVSPVVVTEIKKLPQARTLLQLSLVLGAMGYFLLGQQTNFLFILIIIFFNSVITAGITRPPLCNCFVPSPQTLYGTRHMGRWLRLWLHHLRDRIHRCLGWQDRALRLVQ